MSARRQARRKGPKPKSSPAKLPTAARRRGEPGAPGAEPGKPGQKTMTEGVAARDLFWQNVIRQILTSLSIEWLNRNQQRSLPAAQGPPPEDLFDGRLGILTHAGERIPIAQVFPVPPCGPGADESSRQLSMAIECSVFQIRTPTGEVFTLPLQEMRGFHALTPELMQALEEAARKDLAEDQQPASDGPGTPFGFAAFTSMERANREKLRGPAYPQHPPDAPNPHPDE
jgi:hypothetical protein